MEMQFSLSTSAVARRWAARLAAAFALAVSLAYVPYRLLDPAAKKQIYDLRHQLEQTREATAELERENLDLAREVDALRNDPSAVADIARDDLGMVREGELLIRLEAEAPR